MTNEPVRWVDAIKPSDVIWDDTPLGPDTIRLDGTYTPTSNNLPVLACETPAGELPSDVIGAVIAFAGLFSHRDGFKVAAVAFCRKYGPLGISATYVGRDGRPVTGESIATLTEESHAIWQAYNLLRYLRLLKAPRKDMWWMPAIADPHITRAIAAAYRQGERPMTEDEPMKSRRVRGDRAARAVRKARAQELVESSRARLREVVNDGLTRSGVRQALVADGTRFRLETVAPSLLARLWLRVAAAATERVVLTACENCGRLLVPEGPRKRERMRSDRKTCSRRCRQALAAKRHLARAKKGGDSGEA